MINKKEKGRPLLRPPMENLIVDLCYDPGQCCQICGCNTVNAICLGIGKGLIACDSLNGTYMTCQCGQI